MTDDQTFSVLLGAVIVSGSAFAFWFWEVMRRK